jgi:oligopeptide transport system ATP-binding protein
VADPVSRPLLQVHELVKTFGSGRRAHTAVDHVSFDLAEGEVLGLVGESGSGKSTTVRCLMGLEAPDAGDLDYDRIDLREPTRSGRRRFLREVQLVFQDPYSSLDPRMTVRQLVAEPLVVTRACPPRERLDRVVETLEMVGLESSHLDRHPRAFSGGQRQRIAIARALVVRPRVLVCDEPVSALDVSVQAQVLNLVKDMQRALGLSVLFIAHDLAVVRYLCDRVVVLKDGRVVETGTRDEVYGAPQHEYTRSLLAAVPRLDPEGERSRREARRVAS